MTIFLFNIYFLDDINKITYPKIVDNNDPTKTPILTPSMYWSFSTKAKLPTNKLIVNPIPVKIETPYKLNQFKLFDDLSKKMNKDVDLSIANTGCVMNFPEYTYDWVRCGIGIYGGYFKDQEIKTAMTLRSPIVNIRQIKKGERVGYDGRAEAQDNMSIATVYLGYADGLPLKIKDGTSVMINNQIAEVFGRVSMDLTTIDISNIENCSIGDWCEFFSEDLPMSNIAISNDLISYYFMTGVKSRVKKVYKRTD